MSKVQAIQTASSYKTRIIVVGATAKKNMPDLGWIQGVYEPVRVSKMATGKVAIYRWKNYTPKSGYKVYPTMDD